VSLRATVGNSAKNTVNAKTRTDKKDQKINVEEKFNKKPGKKTGLAINRYFTKDGKDPYESVEYENRSAKIANPDGSVVFSLESAEVPRSWSQMATDILVSKYFRKKGIPQFDKYGNPLKDEEGNIMLGSETSIKQVVERLANCWMVWGERFNYFATKEDAKNFKDESIFMLLNQYGSPNSPQWFNTGLNLSYGITGPAQGHAYVDPKTEELKKSKDAYTRPQPHACFIQSVKDDLVNQGGIMDLISKEARIFKYGSGTGTNFSSLRAEGESLSGGGTSSGTLSWLRILDRSAGAIKSGGTTRRAAKMVILDIDHPDVEQFIWWKAQEEKKAAALIAAGYSSGLEGEAYETVSGQNSNNTVRVNDEFMKTVEEDGDWNLIHRTDRKIARAAKARDLWKQIAQAAWQCADPGIQFDTTINDWHTCPKSGLIRASNPCSEFMFLDDSSCNLASLNMAKFLNLSTGEIEVEAFKHAVRIWTIILEISILMAQFPSDEIALNSYKFRPIGLGYANMGSLFMQLGIAYDSSEARDIATAITAIMTGQAYKTSAEISSIIGPFKEFKKNKRDMLRVIRNHRRAVYSAPSERFEKLSKTPYTMRQKETPSYLLREAKSVWDDALKWGEKYGYRNAQVTLIAPTGTIGLVMDCDTTGIEPDYALVKLKKLIGGGYFKIANQSVSQALRQLNYTDSQISEIIRYMIGTGSLKNSSAINEEALQEKGFSQEHINKINSSLKAAFDINFAFTRLSVGDPTLDELKIPKEKYASEDFNLLQEIGFSEDEISLANREICGTMTIEGAPHLKEEHYAIFDCATKCGSIGQRSISYMGHILMMSAVQPFLSGAISKTINLPSEITVQDLEDIHTESWKLGTKAIAIYRDGSKITQPLNTKTDQKQKVNSSEEDEIGKYIIEYRPVRKPLPKERQSITRKVKISGHKMFLTVGLYPDGKPGELFITMSQQGSFASGMADSFARMVSIGLQYGVPVDMIIRQLRHMRFAPMGYTGDSDITFASSISDYIAQWLKQTFAEGGTAKIKLPLYETKPDTKIEMESTDENYDEEPDITSREADLSLNTISNKELGYTGETCPECGSEAMVQNGNCQKCLNCGATTGCS